MKNKTPKSVNVIKAFVQAKRSGMTQDEVFEHHMSDSSRVFYADMTKAAETSDKEDKLAEKAAKLEKKAKKLQKQAKKLAKKENKIQEKLNETLAEKHGIPAISVDEVISTTSEILRDTIASAATVQQQASA